MGSKKYTITEAMGFQCGNCKFFYQAKNHMSCCNSKSDEKDKYRYYNFVCDYHEAGKQLDKKGLEDLGYVQKTNTSQYANGTSSEYIYYENK